MPVKRAQKMIPMARKYKILFYYMSEMTGDMREGWVTHTKKPHGMNIEELKFYPPFLFSSKHSTAGIYVIVNVVVIIILY